MNCHLHLKPGVRLHGVSVPMLLATEIIRGVWEEAGAESLTITVGIEGTHADYSDHYRGNALDYRTHTLTDPVSAITKVKERLTGDFFVLYEGAGTPNAHLHVSWRPKEAYK